MLDNSTKTSSGALLIGEVRLLFNRLEEGEMKKDGRTRYTAALLIPKDNKKTLALLAEAIKEEAQSRFGNNVNFARIKNPLKDGDAPEREGSTLFAGHYYINVSTYRPPFILDTDQSDAKGRGVVYSGCFGRAVLSVFSFDVEASKGVSFNISAFQKTRDGEPMGNSVDALAILSENPLTSTPEAETAPATDGFPF